MVRIEARRMIAGMHHDLAGRNWPMNDCVGEPVRAPISSVAENASVTVLIFCEGPHQTRSGVRVRSDHIHDARGQHQLAARIGLAALLLRNNEHGSNLTGTTRRPFISRRMTAQVKAYNDFPFLIRSTSPTPFRGSLTERRYHNACVRAAPGDS